MANRLTFAQDEPVELTEKIPTPPPAKKLSAQYLLTLKDAGKFCCLPYKCMKIMNVYNKQLLNIVLPYALLFADYSMGENVGDLLKIQPR